MATIKIHYSKPGSAFDACGRAGSFPELTGNIDEVTCNACLRTVTGHKAGGRPRKTDGRNKTQFVLSDAAIEKLAAIPRGERSKLVSDYLESL